MPEGNSSGSGRRRRRQRRRGRSKDNQNRQFNGQRRSGRSKNRKRNGGASTVRSNRSDSPSVGASRYFSNTVNEFELFCAYYLSLDENGGYRKQSFNDISRRFGVDIDSIKKALSDFKMSSDQVSSSEFDPEMARLDIKVAPEGIDRVELARTIFQELLDSGCGIGPVPNAQTPVKDDAQNLEPEVDGNVLEETTAKVEGDSSTEEGDSSMEDGGPFAADDEQGSFSESNPPEDDNGGDIPETEPEETDPAESP